MTRLSEFALTMTLIQKRSIRLSILSKQNKSMPDFKTMNGMMFRQRLKSEKH